MCAKTKWILWYVNYTSIKLLKTLKHAQYSVITYMGKESEKEWIYIYMDNWITLLYIWN